MFLMPVMLAIALAEDRSPERVEAVKVPSALAPISPEIWDGSPPVAYLPTQLPSRGREVMRLTQDTTVCTLVASALSSNLTTVIIHWPDGTSVTNLNPTLK